MRFNAVAAALFVTVPIALGDDPPEPKLGKTIDYIAWVNRAYGGTIKNNAADRYRAAFEAYVLPGERLGEGLGLWATDEDGPATRAEWIRANERSLRLFAEATRIKECYFPRQAEESGMLISARLPHRGGVRSMYKLLKARAERRFDAGDVAGATEDICVILHAAQHLRAQPNTIEFQVATGMSAGAYWSVREFVVSVRDPLVCRTIIDRLRRIDRAPAIPKTHLLIARVHLWETVQQRPDDPENPYKTQRDIDIAVAEAVRIYEQRERLFAEPYRKARELYEKLQGDDEHIKENIDETREGEVGRTMIRLLASISMPSEWKMAINFRRLIADRNATYLILTIHAYKAKHGRWPKSLTEAAPGELAEFHSDPFSNRDFVYRLDDGKPLLYSVGINGKDDAGKRAEKTWAETGDRVYWPPEKATP